MCMFEKERESRGEGVECVGQVTRGEDAHQPPLPHAWQEWEIRLRATDICVRDRRSQCHGQGQLGLQGVGRAGETGMRRVEEGPGWDGEGRVGRRGVGDRP